MGFRWKDAIGGAINGAEMGGSAGGGWGAIAGGIGGAAVGGYGKDIDKGLTGDSQSGTVEGLMDMGGGMSGYGIKGNSISSLFSMFDKNSDKNGNLNAGNLGQVNGQDLFHTGSGSFQLGDVKGLDLQSLLKMVGSFGGGSSSAGSSGMSPSAIESAVEA